MEKTEWYMGTPNGVVLCVENREKSRFGGRFYHAYSKRATEFLSMDEVLFQMEKFYDSLNYPCPTTNERTFLSRGRGVKAGPERMKVMKDEELLSKHGELGTFIIRVQHRQNNSWQGRITWMEKNRTLYFRSIWEMIKLVAEALDTVSEPEDGSQERSWMTESS